MSKRNKDFTHKTPKVINSHLSHKIPHNSPITFDDSAFACDDLSFIIEDILSKRIGRDVSDKPKKESNEKV